MAEEARLGLLVTAQRRSRSMDVREEDDKTHIQERARKALESSLLAARSLDGGIIDLTSD
jgi:hypothetical protein